MGGFTSKIGIFHGNHGGPRHQQLFLGVTEHGGFNMVDLTSENSTLLRKMMTQMGGMTKLPYFFN